jgi:hypothetical protein
LLKYTHTHIHTYAQTSWKSIYKPSVLWETRGGEWQLCKNKISSLTVDRYSLEQKVGSPSSPQLFLITNSYSWLCAKYTRDGVISTVL